MRRIRLRNAFFRGWFAARAARSLPEPENGSELALIEQGFKAGIESGGRALPLIGNHRPPAAIEAPKPASDESPAEPVLGEAPALDLDVGDAALIDLDLFSGEDDVPVLNERAEAQGEDDEDQVPTLTDTGSPTHKGPVLKQKPQSGSRFFQD